MHDEQTHVLPTEPRETSADEMTSVVDEAGALSQTDRTESQIAADAEELDRWLSHAALLEGLPALPTEPAATTYADLPASDWDHAIPGGSSQTRLPAVPRRHPATTQALSAWTSERNPSRVTTAYSPSNTAQPAAMTGSMNARRLARTDRRIFAALCACAVALLGTAIVLMWFVPAQPRFARLGAPVAIHHATATAQQQASVTAQATATTQPTAQPIATQAIMTPTLAIVQTPVKTTPAVVPTVQALTLACSAPGADLPLHNTGTVPLAWSIAVPAGVLINNWSGQVGGTVDPGSTLTMHVWQTPGAHSGPVSLSVRSGTTASPVRLIWRAC
jgi:hypothetical protein